MNRAGIPINWRRSGYNYGAYGDDHDTGRQLAFHRPLSLHADPNVSRTTSTATRNPWEIQTERVATTRPFNLSRFWEEQVLVPQEVNSTPRPMTENVDNKAVNKLKKEIYNPAPKKISRRVSLYYRSNGRNHNLEKVDDQDQEEGKKCAICLEEFVAREMVMVTPCNHMFHEECIVPWVKSRGQCPVCRFTMGDHNQTSGAGVAPPALETLNNDLFAIELISIMRVMEEAFLGTNFR